MVREFPRESHSKKSLRIGSVIDAFVNFVAACFPGTVAPV